MADLTQVRQQPPTYAAQSRLNLVGVVTGGAAQLVLVWLTARLLSPHEAGAVFTATSAFLLVVTALRLGSPTALVWYLGQQRDVDADGVRSAARLGIVPVVVLTSVVCVLALPLALGTAPPGGAGPLSGLGIAAVLLVLTLPAAVVLEPLLSLSRGLHDMRPTVALDRAGRPVLQVAFTAVAALSPSVASLVAAWCLPYLVCAVIAYLVTPALRTPERGRPLASHGPAAGVPTQQTVSPARFRRYLASRAGTSLVQVAFARLDVVLVAAMTGPGEAAVYMVATRFVVLAQMVQQALATAVEPLLARAGRTVPAGPDADPVSTLYRTATRWSVLLLWPVLGLLCVAPASWLTLFGSAYADGDQVVRVLAAAMVVAVAVGPVETVLAMHGRAGILVWTNVLALSLMVGLDLLLVPGHGASGAALGWATAIVCKNVACLWLVVRLTGGGPVERAWRWALVVNALAATAAALAFRALQGAGNEVAASLAAVVIGAMVVLGGYAACRDRLGLTMPVVVGAVRDRTHLREQR